MYCFLQLARFVGGRAFTVCRWLSVKVSQHVRIWLLGPCCDTCKAGYKLPVTASASHLSDRGVACFLKMGDFIERVRVTVRAKSNLCKERESDQTSFYKNLMCINANIFLSKKLQIHKHVYTCSIKKPETLMLIHP